MATARASDAPAPPDPAPAARTGRRAKPKASPPTLVFFVRHGTTPTTGQVLPGRAPGLHLGDTGRREAEAVAEHLAALTAPAVTGAEAPSTNGATTNGGSAAASLGDGATVSAATRTAATRAAATAPLAGTTAATRANGARTARRGPTPLTIAAVYASPLERAQETAAPIGARLGLPVVVEPGLIEMDFGDWTGAELKTLRKLPEWATIQRYPSGFHFPAGEGFSAMRTRMAETIAALCERHQGQAVVAVSHADTIKAAVSDALGTHLDLFQRIVISPCSVTVINYSTTGPIVLAVNSTGGLGGLRPA
jgi:probable phosphoglycerate mutase